jgi:hypothetical protein
MVQGAAARPEAPAMADRPLAILYEHPEWFKPLFAELERRDVCYEKIRVRDLWYDPAGSGGPATWGDGYSLVVNRVSAYPSAAGQPAIVLFVKQFLAHLDRLGIKVINGHQAYEIGTSKAMQLDLFEQLGVPYPRARVIHDPVQAVPAAAGLTFPVVLKPNIGGSGAGIYRFDNPEDLALAVQTNALDLGIDHTALVQEYLPARDNCIVRVEILNGRMLYAIRLPIEAGSFNYCPADGCNVENPDLPVESYQPPEDVILDAQRILSASRADVGSVEYLTNEVDGQVYYYDINPLSNFVADAVNIIGFDPIVPFVDFVLERATGGPSRPGTRSFITD